MRKLTIVPGEVALSVLRKMGSGIMDVVADTYLLHDEGKTVNPDSHFLRFPNNGRDRIIALPASILDEDAVSGIKWISSYPGNIQLGLPRASAVLVLNDFRTGYPIACIEGSHISAARTAASAALAARSMSDGPGSVARVGVVGGGFIARETLRMLCATLPGVESAFVHDIDERRASAFSTYASGELGIGTTVVGRVEQVFDADVVVLATSATAPYLTRSDLLAPGQIVLHISLRDLSPENILRSWNMVDDIEHCLKARTSAHLAEQLSGGRAFIAGTLADLIRGKISPDRSKPLVFSPFGLGVLDLAVGRVILRDAIACGCAFDVPNFFLGSGP